MLDILAGILPMAVMATVFILVARAAFRATDGKRRDDS